MEELTGDGIIHEQENSRLSHAVVSDGAQRRKKFTSDGIQLFECRYPVPMSYFQEEDSVTEAARGCNALLPQQLNMAAHLFITESQDLPFPYLHHPNFLGKTENGLELLARAQIFNKHRLALRHEHLQE
ncbi:hypothetical protein O6H91_04G129400 [Diphasiastrum complanatum]|uniref:Uncharacterized protein n=1 Tax=Diphasiastrum complanatum TaxID=34168 RepID=A0ACC2E1U6_DIPCM|nr:hypothetical protein O6H91_04G129400 [Diphasiastrum complanatum]